MTIIYRMLKSGAFVAGDTASGYTAYAYPSSASAVRAQRLPFDVAQDMIRRTNDCPGSPYVRIEYDARHWVELLAPGRISA